MNWQRGFVFLATGLAVCLLMAGVACATVDIVGGTSSPSLPNPWNSKGNFFRVDEDVILREHEFYLSFLGQQTFSYYVYDSSTELGAYDLVQTNTVQHIGAGPDWYSSGPLSIPLQAGRYYLLAFSFPSPTPPPVTYYYSTGDSQAVSFGAQIRGFATGFHPLGATVTSDANDIAIYHHRITTVPEPASLYGGAIALALILWYRRRC